MIDEPAHIEMAHVLRRLDYSRADELQQIIDHATRRLSWIQDKSKHMHQIEKDLIDQGRIIEALKQLRLRLGLSLLDSKMLIDDYRIRAGTMSEENNDQ